MAKKYEIDQSKLVKLQDLQKSGVNPYPYGFAQTNHAEELLQKFAHLKAENVMKRRLLAPMIDEAIRALEIAVKEVKLSPKEMQELQP